MQAQFKVISRTENYIPDTGVTQYTFQLQLESDTEHGVFSITTPDAQANDFLSVGSLYNATITAA